MLGVSELRVPAMARKGCEDEDLGNTTILEEDLLAPPQNPKRLEIKDEDEMRFCFNTECCDRVLDI